MNREKYENKFMFFIGCVLTSTSPVEALRISDPERLLRPILRQTEQNINKIKSTPNPIPPYTMYVLYGE